MRNILSFFQLAIILGLIFSLILGFSYFDVLSFFKDKQATNLSILYGHNGDAILQDPSLIEAVMEEVVGFYDKEDKASAKWGSVSIIESKNGQLYVIDEIHLKEPEFDWKQNKPKRANEIVKFEKGLNQSFKAIPSQTNAKLIANERRIIFSGIDKMAYDFEMKRQANLNFEKKHQRVVMIASDLGQQGVVLDENKRYAGGLNLASFLRRQYQINRDLSEYKIVFTFKPSNSIEEIKYRLLLSIYRTDLQSKGAKVVSLLK